MTMMTMRGESSMSIPNDPAILLSYINTLLRDKYDDLDKLCDDLQLDGSALTYTSPQVDFGSYKTVVVAKINGKWVTAQAPSRAVTINLASYFNINGN